MRGRPGGAAVKFAIPLREPGVHRFGSIISRMQALINSDGIVGGGYNLKCLTSRTRCLRLTDRKTPETKN